VRALTLPNSALDGIPARKRRQTGVMTTVLIFLPPALLLFTLFVVLPIGEAAWYSFYSWNGFGRPKNWLGFENYTQIFETRAFFYAIRNNILIIVISLAIQLPLAMAAAIALAEKITGAVAFRMIFFLPYVLAEIATGMIFSFVYDGNYGLLPIIYAPFGVEAPHLLASASTAFPAILVVIIWKYFGFHMMLYIAALQAMDKNLIEAARIDGATRWQVLRYITLPTLYPTIRLSVFFAVIGSLQLFDLIMPLTRGGPADTSQTMVSFLYTHGVMRMRVGYGSAIGVILFIICVTFAFTYKRWFMRND
jgi:raffinose/stachyose/melibiose transport system permease protein